jgi:hypothetical protein
MKADELIAQATCAVLREGRVSGTAWLVSAKGHLLSAGHLFVDPNLPEDVEVRFSEQAPRIAHRIISQYDKDTGIDFAVLELKDPGREPLPIFLAQECKGSFRVQGYGRTLGDRSSGTGQFVGPVDLRNSEAFRLFRLRSQELGEGGYSGAAIFSDELQAVVAIQTEASTEKLGAGRDTVLALPLYRVARLWQPLLQLLESAATHEEADYKYDVFLSYSRTPIVEQWIEEHFVPHLTGRLEELLGKPPEVFYNHNDMRKIWGEEMLRNIRSSRCIIALTSTAYFSQPLCVAEWRSFLKREEFLKQEEFVKVDLLIPLEWQPSDYVSRDIKSRSISFKKYTFTGKGFQNNSIWVDFQQQVQNLADQLVALLNSTPKYNPKFPIVAPESTISEVATIDTKIPRPKL